MFEHISKNEWLLLSQDLVNGKYFCYNNNIYLNFFVDDKNVFGLYIFVIDITDHCLKNIFQVIDFSQC